MSLDLSQCSDGDLAALALGGQQLAYREFLRRYKEPVYRLIRGSIGDADEALDLTRETFVAAFSALKRYEPGRPFRHWVARIALNKCRDWSRRQAVRSFFRKARPIEEAFDLSSDAPSPEAEAGDRAELARVAGAMTNLPQKLRQVLVLCAVEGLTQAEAAGALGVTEKAVETRLYRARQQLAHGLGEKI